MVQNIWSQLFGQSGGRKPTEIITTRVINENVTIDETKIAELLDSSKSVPSSNEPRCVSLPNYGKASKSAHSEKYRSSNIIDVSYFSVYILFASLFVCIFTIALLLVAYINRVTDINQLRDNLKNEFIVKSDIRRMIQVALKELNDEDFQYIESRYELKSNKKKTQFL